MAINLTDSLNAATTKGKLGDAKQVFLNGDTKNLQQAHEETNAHLGTLDNRSTQMENAIKDISVSGGASTASAVSYDNSTSKLEAVTAQGAIDELNTDIQQEIARAKAAEEANTQAIVAEKEKTSEISKKNIETEGTSISIIDDNGNEVLLLDKDGLNAKNIKTNGKDVLTADDIKTLKSKTDKIGVKPADDDEDAVIIEDNNGNKISSISATMTSYTDNSELVEFRDNYNNLHCAIGVNGVYSDKYMDINGNLIYGNSHLQIEEEIDVTVNYINPFIANNSVIDTEAEEKLYINKSYFSAPQGKSKCKLVIICGGGGARAKEDAFAYMNIGKILNYLGYAVLCITGWSREWAHDNGMYAWGDSQDEGGFYYMNGTEKVYLSSNIAPIGNWTAIEEARKAYDYIIDKYPWLDKSGVYLYGESQGGMVIENIAELSGIPVKATILDVPAISMQYAQMYIDSRKAAIKAFYGMENHNFDKTKCIGCDPFTRGMSGDIIMEETSTLPTVDISSLTVKKNRNCKSPILILSGINDTVISTYVHQCYAKALRNNGFPVSLCIFNVGHGVIQYTDVVGKINGYDVRKGMTYVLSFMKRYGGYNYIINN